MESSTSFRALACGLFDARRMDAAVGNEVGERDLRHLAPDGVETGDGHGFRRIVYDHIHACRGFDRPDVPAFAAYQATLHLIVRQRDLRRRGFVHHVGGKPLDGKRDGFLRLVVHLGVHLLFERVVALGQFMLHLGLGGLHDLGASLLHAQVRHLLQLGGLLILERLGFPVFTFDVLLTIGEPGLPEFHGLLTILQALFAIHEPVLSPLYLSSPVAQLGFRLYLGLQRFLFCLQQDAFLLFFRFVSDVLRIIPCFVHSATLAAALNHAQHKHQNHQCENDHDTDTNDHQFHDVSFPAWPARASPLSEDRASWPWRCGQRSIRHPPAHS